MKIDLINKAKDMRSSIDFTSNARRFMIKSHWTFYAPDHLHIGTQSRTSDFCFMKRLSLCTLLLLLMNFYTTQCHAQKESTVDSLLYLISQAKEDTNKVNLLLDLGAHLNRNKLYKEGRMQGESALTLSENLRFLKGCGRAYLLIGNSTRDLGEPEEALRLFNESLRYCRSISYHLGSGKALINIGNTYLRNKEYTRSFDSFHQALDEFKLCNDKSHMGIAYRNIAGWHLELQQYREAISQFTNATLVYKELGDKQLLRALYFGIGKCNLELQSYIEGKYYFSLALELYTEAADKINMMSTCGNLGHIHNKLGVPNEAKFYLDKALHLNDEIGNQDQNMVRKQNLSKIYGYLGNYYLLKKDYKQTEINYKLALEQAEIIQDPKAIAICYGYLIDMYDKQGINSEAKNACLKALDKIIQSSEGSGAAVAHLHNAHNFLHIGNFKEALKHYQAAAIIFREEDDEYNYAAARNGVAEVYYRLGDFSLAYEHYYACLKIYEKFEDSRAVARQYSDLAKLYEEHQNDYAKSFEYLTKAIHLYELAGPNDRNNLAGAYNNMAGLYLRQKKYPEALKYFGAAMDLAQKAGERHSITVFHRNLAFLYLDQNDYKNAEHHFQMALELSSSLSDKQGVSDVLFGLGSIYYALENFDAALVKFNESLKLYEEMGKQKDVANTSLNIANTLKKLNRMDESAMYFKAGLEGAKAIGSKSDIYTGYYGLAYIDSVQGNFQDALKNYKLFTLYKDSVYNDDNEKRLLELQTRFESSRKDKEIELLESRQLFNELELKFRQETLNRLSADHDKTLALNALNEEQLNSLESENRLYELENESQKLTIQSKQREVDLRQKETLIQTLNANKQKQAKNYSLGGLMLIALISFIGYRYYLTRQKLKLQTLRNKIASDLHDDVGSTLSSIAIFTDVARQQSSEVGPMLDTISESSKKMLDAMADIVWTINPENDQFEKILLRMRNFAFDLLGSRNIEFKFVADDHVAAMKLPMDVRKNLYLIFKEATNNMVKYSGADKAHFSIKEEKDVLTMEIRDNGKGFDMESRSTGNGLKNMQRRAEEMKGRLKIVSRRNEGTSITLSVAV